MNTKLLILFISFITFFGIFISRKQPLKFLFWMGISFVFIRVLAIPLISEINMSYTIFTFLILLNPYILLDKKQLKEWRYWYLVLLLGIINSFIFGQQRHFFIDQDILTKAFDWSTKFLVIIFVSSSITYYVKTEKDLKKLMHLFLMSCFIFSFTATISYFGFYDGLVIYGPGSLGDVQDLSNDLIHSVIYGISPSNLVFGVSAIAIVFIPHLSWKKWQKYLFLAVIVFSVIISIKRMAIICLILCLFYYLLIEKKKGSNTWLLIIPLIVLFLGTTYYDLLYKRFFGGFEMGINSSTLDKSTITRLNRFNFAWEMFLSNPLIGQGAGYLSFIHNGFLEILGNLGIVGLVLFKPLIRPLRNIRTTFYNPWAVGLIIIMITLVSLEAAINRVEIMYFIGLLYGGFLVSTKLRTNRNNE